VSRLFPIFLLVALCVPLSCQQAGAARRDLDSTTKRQVEILIRSTFNVPVEYKVEFGERSASDLPGYYNLPVVLSKDDVKKEIDFLISSDGKRLEKLETYDVMNNPALHIDITGRPVRGNPQALVTVINFDDLECPFCARMHRTLFPTTIERYGQQVRFIYMDNPITEIHPWALRAAVDANCLAEQSSDAYWAFVDYIHSHPEDVNGEQRDVQKSFVSLDRITMEHGHLAHLDVASLSHCVQTQDDTQVRKSISLAERLGADGTPAVFVNGERVTGGAVPSDQLWMVVDRALRSVGESPPAPIPSTSAASH
jgi:protein-disulfide isomerase